MLKDNIFMKIARSAVDCLAGIALAAGLASCLADTQPASDGSCGKVPVCLSGSICQEYVTRADANGFAEPCGQPLLHL